MLRPETCPQYVMGDLRSGKQLLEDFNTDSRRTIRAVTSNRRGSPDLRRIERALETACGQLEERLRGLALSPADPPPPPPLFKPAPPSAPQQTFTRALSKPSAPQPSSQAPPNSAEEAASRRWDGQSLGGAAADSECSEGQDESCSAILRTAKRPKG
mmetsp:Transcript_71799/g.191633  ORF Transcript_71799/g.191633 Transcript_71799/m.191633 type:complete len:157 (+) Transcript_71799:655-1125(+)